MENNFLNFVNTSIGENARFVRDFKANPDKYITPKQPSATEQMMQMMGPMLMLMLFQMMPRQGSSAPTGLPSEYFPPLIPKLTDLTASTAAKAPAVAYLEELFKGKEADNPDATEVTLSTEDVNQIKAALAAGTVKSLELGQALKYELHKAPAEHLPAVSRLITDLMDAGQLNAGPFLQNDYLAQLAPERRDTLLSAIELAGLRMDSGKSNIRFIGFLLDNLSRDDQPHTQALIRRFLQDFYDAHGNAPDTPVGKILASVLELADVTVGEDQALVFP